MSTPAEVTGPTRAPSIVVYMGDNGEALLCGKGTRYQRGTNVPLMVRWPGVEAPGTRSDIL